MIQLQNWAFNLSFLINLIWFSTSDILIKDFEVSYYTPPYLKPALWFLDTLQLVITILYFSSYYTCKYELAAFRYDKAKKEKEK